MQRSFSDHALKMPNDMVVEVEAKWESSLNLIGLSQVLQQHGPSPKDVKSNWPIIGQFSSIGSLGNNKDRWLCGEWLQSLSATSGIGVTSKPPLHLVRLLCRLS